MRALYDGLIANRIDAIYGIVNGTCNYILTAMAEGKTYAQALTEAQREGLAEADPTLDVGGADSAHKLTILGGLAFGAKINLADIFVEGIDHLDLRNIVYGQDSDTRSSCWRSRRGSARAFRSAFGRRLSRGSIRWRGFRGRSTPSAFTATRPAIPCITVAAQAHADGVGGGRRHRLGGHRRGPAHMNELRIWADNAPQARTLPIEAVQSRYYLRLTVDDRPGVFGKLATVLGSHQISISSILQHEPPSNVEVAAVPVIITTHRAVEGNLHRRWTSWTN